MNTREKMKSWRVDRQLDTWHVAKACKISERLLKMVEAGETTVPSIAKRIQDVYKLTDLEAEELVPVNYRLHGGDYDPDRYAPIDSLDGAAGYLWPKRR